MDAFLTAALFDSSEIMDFYWNKLSCELKCVIHNLYSLLYERLSLMNRNSALDKAAADNCHNAISYMFLPDKGFETRKIKNLVCIHDSCINFVFHGN